MNVLVFYYKMWGRLITFCFLNPAIFVTGEGISISGFANEQTASDGRLLHTKTVSAPLVSSVLCGSICKQKSPWCHGFWPNKETGSCTLMSKNNVVKHGDETYDQTSTAIMNSISDNPEDSNVFVLQEKRTRSGGYNDLTVVTDSGKECPLEKSGFPDIPTTGSGEVVIRNGHTVYRVGLGLDREETWMLDLSQKPWQWIQKASWEATIFCCFGSVIVQNKIWVFGGKTADCGDCNTDGILSYDMDDDASGWTEHTTKLTQAAAASAVYFSSTEVWVFTHGATNVFNPQDGTIVTKPGSGECCFGYSIQFAYVEMNDGVKGFLGASESNSKLVFFDKNQDQWRNDVFGNYPAGATYGFCMANLGKNLFMLAIDHWYLLHPDYSITGPHNDEPFDMVWGTCGSVSKAFFPEC